MFGFPVNLQEGSPQKMTYDADNGFQKIQRREVFYSLRDGVYETMQWQTLSGRVGLLPGIDDDVIIRHNVFINNTIQRVRNFIVTQSGYITFTGALGTTIACNNYKNYGIVDFTIGLGSLTIYGNDNYFGNTYLKNTGASNTIIRYWGTDIQLIHKINYGTLELAGGPKYIDSDLYVNGNLVISTSSILDLSTYNIDVIGSTNISGSLNKTGAGTVLMRGVLNYNAGAFLDFSAGNPTVELRGGISYLNFTASNFKTGTGQWSFTTNNQTITHNSSTAFITLTFNCPVLISGAITVTHNTSTAAQGILLFNNSINGDNVNSKLISIGTINMANASFPQPMTTGIIDLTTNSNTLIYSFNGNYTIPYTALSGLRIGGTGTKTLSNSITLSGSLNIDNNSKLELSTYDLSVTGTTSLNASGLLSKTGTGNVLFIGQINMGNNNAAIDFSLGNPTVELRGGINTNSVNNSTIKTGIGQWSFTTNNQSILAQISLTFDCPILISGAITLTIGTSSASVQYNNIFNGVINGNNINSKLGTSLAGASALIITYNNPTQPMATGILDTSTILNTFIYGNANQDIKGGPSTLAKQVYRNLTLNGGGVKTLQGYVSVLNTYTLTAPATLANNGFTLTNP